LELRRLQQGSLIVTTDPRQKRYDPPRLPKLESQFGFAGSWNGKRRVLEPSARPQRQRSPHGGLSESQIAELPPEMKIALANGWRSDGR
jgi:hypothetical protein